MKVKEESEKVGLKLNIQKMKIMASGPITLWQIDGETVETVSGFILGDSKITADGDCSHESLLLGGKVMTNLDSILKATQCSAISERSPLLPSSPHIPSTVMVAVFAKMEILRLKLSTQSAGPCRDQTGQCFSKTNSC